MTKYENPFYTLNELHSILCSVGLDMVGEDSEWTKSIINISVDKHYEEATPYFSIHVQLSLSGLREVIKKVDSDRIVTRTEPMSSVEYCRVSIVPSPLVELFAVAPIGEVQADEIMAL